MFYLTTEKEIKVYNLVLIINDLSKNINKQKHCNKQNVGMNVFLILEFSGNAEYVFRNALVYVAPPIMQRKIAHHRRTSTYQFI